MANLVLISQAVEHSKYHANHLRYLVRKGFVAGQKHGGVWLLDLADLQKYEQKMEEMGAQKHTTKRYLDEGEI